ncbi:hypothetical protein [Tenacibaculum sp. 190524A02b]|uniref:hypothetical protein n=1 Tax=Tenacibaculum vairaonense TaxID=3137860 RepID=UPI0031FA7328
MSIDKQESKELSNLIEKKIIQRSLNVENRLVELQKKLEKELKKGDKRYNKLISEIDKKFPPKTPKRGFFDGIASIVFDTAFELYFIGNNSALIIELQGLLERFCLNTIIDLIPINDITKEIVSDGFEKKTLRDIAPYFKLLGVWEESDVKFALKLTQIRNGIAHKNGKLVSKHLGSGQQSHPESIHEITAKVDIIPFILSTMELIIKATKVAEPEFLKNPRLRARYETYLNIIGGLSNMYCHPEIIHMPKHIKDLYLNDQFSKIYLIGQKDLRDEISRLKIKIIDFHDSLGSNDEKAKSLHKEISDSIEKVFFLMKEDLAIDAKPDFFKQPKSIDIKEALKRKKTMHNNV